ncbi:MAG: DUF3500 domain-containing protein [Janthinobacterium lividum]
MKKSSYLTALLVAASIGRAGTDQLLAAPAKAAARPATAKTTKTVKSVKSVSSVSDVVTAANAFIATLTTAQQATLLQTYNATNVVKWSNLPCGSSCRLGLQFTNLSQAQVTAALAVVRAATGTVANDGFDETQQIRSADDNLGTQRSGYSAGIYFIAFLGTPSTTGTWMLQFGGHHLATNVTFGNGLFTGPTPKFEGVEPLSFTGTANAAYGTTAGTFTPMGNEASAMTALVNGLTTAHKASAKLTQTFSDVVLGPGTDGQFPTTRVGIQCSQLTTAEQQLVINAMYPWVQDADDATAAFLMGKYTDALASTYISYSGTGNFTTNADYARIDGPNVWIEFVAQTGVVYNTQTHFHSIWRDRARDYGGNFYGTVGGNGVFTTALGTKATTAGSVFSVYPNPTAEGSAWQIQLIQPSITGTYTLRNSLGQTVKTSTFYGGSAVIPTEGLASGMYTVTVDTPTQLPTTTKVQLN